MEDRFRRPRDELFEAEAVELAPSEEGEVVMQLGDKIRQQAKRLTSLEQYRLLIEKRLRELSPSHPLPVLPTHLGKDVPDELQALRARVEELEAEQQVPMTENFTFPHPSTQLKASQLQELYQALYFKHHGALKDKAALEESLRAEMLTSEEQRTYIEVLKQAVETKMDSAGVVNQTVDSFAEYTTTRTSQEQSRKDAQRLSSTIRDQEVGIKRLQEQSRQLYESLQHAEAEVERLQEANDETASALLSYEDELQKVTAEKDALLEYVDIHDRSETELKGQINALQTEISELKAQGTLTARTSKQLGEVQRKAQEDQEQQRSLIQKHEKSVTQLTLALEEARSRASEQTDMLTSLREQTGALQSKNEALQANNFTLANTLQETQSEFEALQTSYDEVSAELSDATAEVVFLREEVERLTDLTSGLQGTLKETGEIGQQRDLRLTKAEQEFADLERVTSEQLEKECSENAELRLRLNKSKESHERIKQKSAALEGELKETQNKLEQTRLALRKSEKTAASLELELEDKRVLYGEVKEKFDLTATQKDALASELRRLEIDFTAHHSSAQALEDENSSLRARVEELTRNLKAAREGFQDRETRLQRAFGEVNSLRTEDEQLRSELSHLQAECAAKTQELSLVKTNERRLQGDSQRMDSELRDFRQSFTQSSRVLANFAQNFGVVSHTSSVFSVILSNPLKDALSRLGHAEVSPRAVEEWVRLSVEELEALVRRLADLKADLQASTVQLSSLQAKLSENEFSWDDFRDREQQLRLQLERALGDKAELEDEHTKLQGQTDALHQEIGVLRRSVQEEAERSSKWKDQLTTLTSDIPQWRQTAEVDPFSVKVLEEKVNLLVKEKKDLELLLSRLQAAVPSSELQRVFLDMMRTRSDMELSERDRLRVENQLVHLEGEMRSKARVNSKDSGPVRREVEALRGQLSQVNLEIHGHKRRLNALEEELQSIEVAERRRAALSMDTERSNLKMRETLREKSWSPTTEDRPQLSLYEKLSQAKTTLSEIKRRTLDNI
jgi:chromosome segregation ATPase